jgi:lipid-binding SYLF domain-containing protein
MFKRIMANTTRTTLMLAAFLGLAACASIPPTRDDTQARVDAARTTLSNFMHDPEMTWFREHVGSARAVMISPQIVQAGFIVGGSGGPALVIARNRAGTGWNGPAFYRIAAGSIGLQAGAQASEMVALLMTDKAVNSLMSTSFKLGGDVSVAAGPVGAGTGAPVTADMVVYTRSKGLYGGVNLDGTVITVDDGRNGAYYGQATTPVDILVTRSVSNPYGATLAQAATSAVSQGR